MRALTFAFTFATVSASLLGSTAAFAQRVDWANTSGDPGAMRYAPVADIDRSNVGRLKLAWRWNTGEQSVRAGANQKAARPGLFQASPIVLGDTMYVSTPYAAVAALDARTGRELWKFDPEMWRTGQPSNGTGLGGGIGSGSVTRGPSAGCRP